MEPWAWVLAYLVGFTLFQLLLFRYFSDGRALGDLSFGSGETAGPRSVDPGHPAREDAAGAEAADADAVYCPRCGAENDDEQPFTYCHNCVAQLR